MSRTGCGWNLGCVPAGGPYRVRLERQAGTGHHVFPTPHSEDDDSDNTCRMLSRAVMWWSLSFGKITLVAVRQVSWRGGRPMQVEQRGGKRSVEFERGYAHRCSF